MKKSKFLSRERLNAVEEQIGDTETIRNLMLRNVGCTYASHAHSASGTERGALWSEYLRDKSSDRERRAREILRDEIERS